MDRGVKEAVTHGTEGYPFALYVMRNVKRLLQVPMHWHDELEIIYVEKGKLYVTIGTDSYEGVAGDIFIVNSSEMHSMYIDSMDTCYVTALTTLQSLMFLGMDDCTKEYLMPLLEQKVVFAHKITGGGAHDAMEESIGRMIDLNMKKEPLYQLGTKLCLLEIIYQLYLGDFCVKAESRSKDTELSRAVLSYIRLHYTEDVSLSQIAGVFHMSEKYFSRWFKNNFRLSYVDYITQLRISKATDLLTKSELSITEIALQCGFGSSSYFNKRFKAIIGETPRDYRRV